MNTHVNQLLQQVSSLLERHCWLETKQGQRFNIFEILRRETDEVFGHSALIGELLDPEGSHGQSDLFLKHFLSINREKIVQNVPDFDFEAEFEVYKEKSFDDGQQSGRIDITVESARYMIVIENKINAPDQPRQLERYFEHARAIGKTPILIYLTPNGLSPGKYTLGDLHPDQVVSMSYDSEIANWIHKCRDSVSMLAHIRESLNQYLIIVRRISSSTQSRELTMDIDELLKAPRNFEAALALEKALPTAKAELQLRFWNALREKLQTLFPDQDGNYLKENVVTRRKLETYVNKAMYVGISYEVAKVSDSASLVFTIRTHQSVAFTFLICEQQSLKEFDTEHSKAIMDALLMRDKRYKVEPNHAWLEPEPKIRWRPQLNEKAASLVKPEVLDTVAEKYFEQASKILVQLESELKERKLLHAPFCITPQG